MSTSYLKYAAQIILTARMAIRIPSSLSHSRVGTSAGSRPYRASAITRRRPIATAAGSPTGVVDSSIGPYT
jgi:hypothetical protein